MWNARRLGFTSFSWDKIAALGRICAALELWFLLMALSVSKQDKITFGVTAPCFLPPPTCLYCCWVVGQVISVTGLLLRFARWTYVNCVWDAWKTATAGGTSCGSLSKGWSCATSIELTAGAGMDVPFNTRAFNIHSLSVCSPCRRFPSWPMFVPLPPEWSQLRTCFPSWVLCLRELAFFLRPFLKLKGRIDCREICSRRDLN